MKFYTYNYLLSRIEVTNWVQIVLIVLATSVLLFGVFKYYKEKKQSKYRELALIALFLVLILVGIRINEEIVINTQAARDGAIIRVPENRFFRVIYADGKILLENMEIYNPQIEIIDAESTS